MKKVIIATAIVLCAVSSHAEYLGQYTANKYSDEAIQPGTEQAEIVRNSMQNQYSTGGPRLENEKGEFRGNLNGNRYDSDSVSNPYGQYGSRYSADSINNPYGAGSKYDSESPNNPYGSGLKVFDE